MATGIDYILQVLRDDAECSQRIAHKLHRKMNIVKKGKGNVTPSLQLRSVKGIHVDGIYTKLNILCPELMKNDSSWLRETLRQMCEQQRIENINDGLENIKPMYKLLPKTLAQLQQLEEEEQQPAAVVGSSSGFSGGFKGANAGGMKFKVKSKSPSTASSGVLSKLAKSSDRDSATAIIASKKQKISQRNASARKKKQSDKLRDSRKTAGTKRKLKKISGIQRALKR